MEVVYKNVFPLKGMRLKRDGWMEKWRHARNQGRKKVGKGAREIEGKGEGRN